MLCMICGSELVSNRHLRNHVLMDHHLTWADYFKSHPDATKYCSLCKRALPIGEFYLDSNRPNGYRTRCIHCIHPDSRKEKCPLCHRVFQQSWVIHHLEETHGILPVVSYQIYLKEKYCIRCKTVRPLEQFYRLNNDIQSYSSYCRECNSDRIRKDRSSKRTGLSK